MSQDIEDWLGIIAFFRLLKSFYWAMLTIAKAKTKAKKFYAKLKNVINRKFEEALILKYSWNELLSFRRVWAPEASKFRMEALKF